MPTFWIIYCWKPETGELLKRLLLQNTKENVQSSLLQRTNRIFCWCRDFFLSVSLMDWNTLGWFVCIWSCSEESQLRVSMNLDRGKTVWVLGFFFFSHFCLFFFFFFLWISAWFFFIRAWVFFFNFWVNGLEAVLLGLCFILWISPCFILFSLDKRADVWNGAFQLHRAKF